MPPVDDGGQPSNADRAVAEVFARLKRVEARQDAFDATARWVSDNRVEARLGKLERNDALRQSDLEGASNRIVFIDRNVGRVRDEMGDLSANVHSTATLVRALEEKATYFDIASIVRRLDDVERLVPETRMRRIEMRAGAMASAVAEATDRWSIVSERVSRIDQHLMTTDRELVGLRSYTRLLKEKDKHAAVDEGNDAAVDEGKDGDEGEDAGKEGAANA